MRTESGLVVLSDAGLRLAPPAVSPPAFKRYFRELAEQGQLFFLDGEDRSHLREHEESFPHFVLDLRRVERIDGLVGGHFVV